MPPRYAYWTILIDNAPTAFRAKEQADLLPTLQQLRRTNKDVTLKWFAHGRLWDSPALAVRPRPPREDDGVKRGHDWRPGGQHKDPRARFDNKTRKKSDRPRDDRPRHDAPRGDRPAFERPQAKAFTRPPTSRQPWHDRPRPPHGAGSGDRDRRSPSAGSDRRPPGTGPGARQTGGPQKPWRPKPSGPPRDRDRSGADRPWQGRPRPPAANHDRSGSDRGPADRARFDRPPSGRPPSSHHRQRPPADRRSDDQRPPASRADRGREAGRGRPDGHRGGWTARPRPFAGAPPRRPDDSSAERRRKPKEPKTPPDGSDNE